MPRLPLEYWLSSMIMAIVVEASKPLAMDDFMDLLRKIGYAQVRVEIDFGKPLKSSVLIKGRGFFDSSSYTRTSRLFVIAAGDWDIQMRAAVSQMVTSLPTTATIPYSKRILWQLGVKPLRRVLLQWWQRRRVVVGVAIPG